MKSFDTELSEDEKKELAAVKSNSPAFLEEEAKYLHLRKMVCLTASESFSPDFTDNVLDRIDNLELQFLKQCYPVQFLFSVFRPFAVAAALLIAVLGYYSWYTIDIDKNEGVSESMQTIMDEADLAYVEELL